MKKNLFFLIIALIFSNSTIAEEILIASGHPDWPPYEWENKNRIIGVGAELVEMIFKDMGIKVCSKAVGNWKRVQLEAKKGDIDVIVACYKTEEREQYLVYPSSSFTNNYSVIWVSKGKTFPFNKWEDLIGKTGVAMLGESYGNAFDTFIKKKLTMFRVSRVEQIFKMLEKDRADYFPLSLYAVQIKSKQLGYENKLEYLPTPLNQVDVYFAFSKESKFLRYLPGVEKGIKKYKKNGTVDKLFKKYIELATIK